MTRGEPTATVESERATERPLHLYLSVVHPEVRHVALRVPDTHRELSIGRARGSDIVLAGNGVSRCHAFIRPTGESGAHIRDNGSKNGVNVNGSRVEEHELRPGDVLRIGHSVAVIRACRAPPGEFLSACDGLWGSETMTEAVLSALTVADSTVPVLISGESGSGKELLARALHQASGRSGSFVAVNCGALTATLVEAELFGHERGAFTGAMGRSLGLVRQADGGTLFLDELAELSAAAQSKLLRVLQEGEVLPVGAVKPVKVDVRVISATHAELVSLVDEGEFRLDLYHRLVGVRCKLPALRERREDILPLFRRFVGLHSSAPARWSGLVAEALCLYPWPGNVRELQRCAQALAAQYKAKVEWTKAELPKHIGEHLEGLATQSVPRPSAMSAKRLQRQLEANSFNKSRTAEELGVSRQTLYAWIKKFGLDRATD